MQSQQELIFKSSKLKQIYLVIWKLLQMQKAFLVRSRRFLQSCKTSKKLKGVCQAASLWHLQTIFPHQHSKKEECNLNNKLSQQLNSLALNRCLEYLLRETSTENDKVKNVYEEETSKRCDHMIVSTFKSIKLGLPQWEKSCANWGAAWTTWKKRLCCIDSQQHSLLVSISNSLERIVSAMEQQFTKAIVVLQWHIFFTFIH